MRRKDREITDIKEITAIMRKCKVCSLAFFDEEYPYIVPLNFGFCVENDTVAMYFHGANAGKKLELLQKNSNVSFEMHCSERLIDGENACDYTMEYESVCGIGIAEILNSSEKISALEQLMKQYSDRADLHFEQKEVDAVAVLKVTANEIHGKRLKR